MPRLVLLPDSRSKPADSPHRAAATEGEAAKRLLEAYGYPAKRQANGQWEFACPFHEPPGPIPARKGTNFYVNAQTSTYFCQAASCGERGNLVLLERHFGIDASDPVLVTRETQLRAFEEALTAERRAPFHAHGLFDTTIERFRLGYDFVHDRYVIPYLEGRRPVAFRYYQPYGDPKFKYTWEPGASARLFNASDAVGDANGLVWLAEGEQKAMLLCQLGYAAVAVPGASTFKTEWHAAFADAKRIVVCFDNDDPACHVHERCSRCGPDGCKGHNPGQEAAAKVTAALGWRATNVVLPRPDGEPKTDINEYIMRDGRTAADLAELALGVKRSPYTMTSLRQLLDDPPQEAKFIVAQGILPHGGRLLVSGAPKTGKSIFVENLALSIGAGIPLLHQFPIDEPRRVGLLDRELSRRSLYDRLSVLVEDRPGYLAALDNLHIDHDIVVKLDRKEGYDALAALVEGNGLDVLILDTAYKFFSGSFTNEDNVKRAFDTLDAVIAATGVAVVLTHHHRKRPGDRAGGKEGPGDPDDVVGTFLWTGWPQGTVLLNFLDRRVDNPFNTVCSFVAFREDAPPEPLALYRNRTSIAYSAVRPYAPDTDGPVSTGASTRLDRDSLAELLLEHTPIEAHRFLAVATAHFGCSAKTVKPWLIDLVASGHFTRDDSCGVAMLRHDAEVVEERYEDDPDGRPSVQLHLIPGGDT